MDSQTPISASRPILPLLVNSRVDDRNVPVDFRFPDDAREQLQRAREFMRQRFGQYPRGLWPSEGSVSDDVAALAAAYESENNGERKIFVPKAPDFCTHRGM